SAIIVMISSVTWICDISSGRIGLSPCRLEVNSTARISPVVVPSPGQHSATSARALHHAYGPATRHHRENGCPCLQSGCSELSRTRVRPYLSNCLDWCAYRFGGAERL